MNHLRIFVPKSIVSLVKYWHMDSDNKIVTHWIGGSIAKSAYEKKDLEKDVINGRIKEISPAEAALMF